MPDPYPQHWEADVLLRDGRPCHLRPIRSEDAEALREFHSQLSEETIYFRFFAPYPELSERDVDRFTNVDYFDRMAFVATQGGEIVGVGRYDRVDDESAEVAFTIRDDHQGRGLGSVLLEHIAAAARERGFRRFVAQVLPSNQRMLATFTEAGYRVSQHMADGVIALEFDIEPTAREEAVMLAREHRAEARSVEALLFPRKVAVIGAGDPADPLGALLVRNLRTAGFTGSLYAIHPEATEVADLRTYATVAEAPGPIDLAIVTAPIDSVSALVADCEQAGVRALEVITSGFSDLDPHGSARARTLVAKSHEAGMRVIGPEALGIVNTDLRVQLNASLADVIPGRGRIGFFCESGTLGATFLEEMQLRGLGLSTFVSPGMRVDVSVNDLLQYWETDDATSVVLLYLQGLGNTRKFSRIVRGLARRKPVLAVLAGRGRNAEGALPDHIVTTLLQQSGVLVVKTIGALLDASALLSLQPLPRGPRVALVSNSTALLVHTRDLVRGANLVPVPTAFRVPWDAGGEAVGAVLQEAIDEGDVDAVIVIHVPPIRVDLEGVAGVLRDVAEKSTKPVLAVLPHMTGLTGRASLVVNPGASGTPGPGSVPVFGEPAAAVAALAQAVRYRDWLATPVGEEPDRLGIDDDRAEELVVGRVGPAAPLTPTTVVGHLHDDATRPLRSVAADTVMLDRRESADLLAAYGLEVWPSLPVRSEQEAVAAADELGYPVVLKVADVRLAHRLDLGGVRLNIENELALRTAYMSVNAQLPSDVVATLTLQAMAPPGVPCTVRTVEDPAFGPIIGFAVGGYLTDVVSDWAYAMPPLTDVDAEALIRSPKTSALLFGYQGSEPANVPALSAVLMRLAQLASDWPQVRRLTVNPMLAAPSGCYLLGAEVELRRAAMRPERRPRRM